jgi:hypothetical protein
LLAETGAPTGRSFAGARPFHAAVSALPGMPEQRVDTLRGLGT